MIFAYICGVKRLTILLTALLVGFTCYAQQRGFISGSVYLIEDEESDEKTPGTGAMILVAPQDASKKDTLYTIVGEKGTFVLRGIPAGQADVRISLIGYEEMQRQMNIKPGENKITVELRPSREMLAEAVVKETAEVITIKQDTLVFNPAAVKVNKGEMAIDILEQMPGVTVSDNGVSILDENLATVYIDGSLLFSNDPMAALEQLPAEEVDNIKSFTEYANKDPNHVISLTESKQRVLDITTKNKPKMVVNGDFIAGGGFDTDTTYHKFRYRAGGSVNMNSESLRAGLNFNINNINDASSRNRGNRFRQASGGGAADLRAISVSATVNRTWMSKEARNFSLGNIGGSYSYSNNYTVNESRSQQIYFPSDKYKSRESNTKSYSDNTNGTHRFTLQGRKSLKDGRIGLNANYSITNSANNSLNSNYNQQDLLPRQGTSSSSKAKNHSSSFGANFDFNKGFGGKFYVNLDAGFNKGNSDGVTAKVDTTTSTIAVKVLDINSDGSNHNYSISPSLTYRFGKRGSLSLNYNYDNTRNVTERVAMNVTDPYNPIIDTVNTERLTNDNNSHTASLSFNQYFEKIKANMRVSVGYQSTGLNRVDAFPEEDTYGKRFNSVTGNFRFGNESMLNHWNLNYSTSGSAPSLEQVRPRLNNTDLYSVTAGNRNLKQSRNHNMSFSYSTVLGSEARQTLKNSTGNNWRAMQNFTTLSLSGNFRMNNDVIVSKRTYFATETYLPEYDYTMPAQSTLTSYENVANSYSASANANLEMQLKKINCILTTTASMSWDNSPSYVNDKLTTTDNPRPTLAVGPNSNFSRNFRFNIRANGSYIYSSNTEKDDVSYFTERLTVGFELNNILKHIYAGGNYNKVFTQGLNYGQMNDNILNLNIGAKFGPRNNLDVSISANDIFNKTTGFSTSMASDFVRNSWTHNFGRYVMFTVAYRFNSMSGRGGGGGDRGGRGDFQSGGGPGGPGGFPGGGRPQGGGFGGGNFGGR